MRLRSFIPLVIIVFVLLTAGIYGFVKYLKPQIETPQNPRETKALKSSDVIVDCSPADTACERKNEKIKNNQLEGAAVSFARHQCDGPRPCPTPAPEIASAAMAAIRTYAKDPQLELNRITGVNARDLIYYCAAGDQCWSYDVKTKKVTAIATEESPTSSPSAKVN